ncbi:hypothetical protein DRQ25_05165 [Candidatus Fermentibacteria bacterium]|nr:MAG: hypothetical protein DRQ25_05165 [Candidatus Fermentibacteria bacterium]
MKLFEQYIYVDASWQIKKNDHTEFKRWKRIQVSDLESKIIKPSSNHNCFMSIQRYRDAVSTRERPEDAKAVSIGDAYQHHYCGLFFDFDAKPEKGEDKAFAIARAQTDTRRLVSFFLERFEDINPAHVQIWFSGSKGFHVLVRPEIFGIVPHTHLTTMIKNMAWSLADLLDLKTLDRTVYTISRLWRIENSVHQSTGLRKIELEGAELARLTATQIMALAKTPRLGGVYDSAEYESVAPVAAAAAWWKDWVTYFDWQKEVYSLRPKKRVERPTGEDGLPACIADIVENGPKDGGKNRNHVAMVLATYWKDMGYSRDACVEEVDNWTVTHYAHRADNELRENISNGRSAVRSVYADHKYAFTCGAIKACGGPTAKVLCAHPDCNWVKEPSDQDPEEIPTLHLSEASQGVYLGKMVRIPVHVSGKADSPFGLPLKGEVKCPTDPKLRCKACPRSDGINYITPWQFGTGDRTILKLIDVTDNQRKGAIKASLGIPNECYKAKVHYIEHGTLEAVRMVPMVDYSQAYKDDGIKDDEVTARSSQHAVRDGYFIGHGIVPNRKYTINTHAYEHPKDQHIVHLFDNAEPNKNDIEHFRLSSDMREKLMVFQPRKGQTVEDKFAEIHGDLCANVHSINGVLTMATAMDLAFHSVIGFNLRGNLVEKGWFELLVVGDSGTGKGGRPQDRILTPDGWTTYGKVQVGDYVIGSNGRQTRVDAVMPRGRLPMYEVSFRDGASVVVSGDHLWAVGNTNWERDGHRWKIKGTKELLDSGLRWDVIGAPSRSKFWIPTVEPVQFAPTPVQPLHPYVLGVLLGDGGMTGSTPRITNPEQDILDRVETLLPLHAELHNIPTDNDCPTVSVVGIHGIIKELGLRGKKSEAKFIPRSYLFGSVLERVQLLRGLCDTDGFVVAPGRYIEYSTSSPQLAIDVMFLVRSLGGLVHTQERVPAYTYKGEKREGLPAYRIGIHFPPGIVPVQSHKHLSKWEGKAKRYHRTIESIKPVGEDECICIKVAADDGLYVGDDFVVTHNSTLIKRLIEHYRVGEMVASEGAKRTGLVWASVQIGGKWTLIWGKIPQNDRGLLVLDEFAEMDQDEVAKLTQLRSEGKAMGQGVSAEYETWARTRLIFLTNVRDDNDISYYNFGIQAVNSIFKAKADTRRVDLAVAVRKGEVSKKLVHKTYKPGEVAHVYTSDLCHNLILWAWSRNPKHIEFVDDAEELVFFYSLEIGARYDSDIYLVETNDMRHKISRVACAVAARMFSTDEKGIKVLVKPEHVEFAARLFDRCYGRGNPRSTMRYHVYAQRWQTRNDYSAPRRELFMKQIEDYPDQKQIVWALLDIQDFRKMDLKDQLPMPKEEFEQFWTFLIKEKFVGRHHNQFRKSGTFNDFLNGIAYDFKLEDPDNEPPF